MYVNINVIIVRQENEISVIKLQKKNNSPHSKFYRFLFPFSSKFPDLSTLYLLML